MYPPLLYLEVYSDMRVAQQGNTAPVGGEGGGERGGVGGMRGIGEGAKSERGKKGMGGGEGWRRMGDAMYCSVVSTCLVQEYTSHDKKKIPK